MFRITRVHMGLIIGLFAGIVIAQFVFIEQTSAQTIPLTSGSCSYSQTGATTTSSVSGGTNTYKTYVVQASGTQNAKGGKVDATCSMPSSSSGNAVQIVNGRALGPHVGGSISAPGTCVTYTPEPGYGKRCSDNGNEIVFQDDGTAIFVNNSLRHCVGVSSFCSSNVYSRGHQNTSYKVSGSTVTTNTSGNAIKGAGLFDYSIVSLVGNNTSTTAIGAIPVRFVVHNTWDGNYQAKYLLTIRFFQPATYAYPTPAYAYPTPAYAYPTPVYNYPTPAYAYPYPYPTPTYAYPTPAYAYPYPTPAYTYPYPTPYLTPYAYPTPYATPYPTPPPSRRLGPWDSIINLPPVL